jgi:hypothetical protein
VREYLTDLIDIITDTYDKNGVKTGSATQTDIAARIEDKNQMVRNQNGQEVASTAFLMVDKNAAMAYNSRVKLKKQNGITMPQTAKERAILSLGKAHGFEIEYWRVWL